MAKPQTLGSRLAQERREKAAREAVDIGQADIAKRVGVSVATYSRYEADITKPDDEILGKIADYFGVTRGWLRFGEGEKRPVDPRSKLGPRDERPAAPVTSKAVSKGRGR